MLNKDFPNMNVIICIFSYPISLPLSIGRPGEFARRRNDSNQSNTSSDNPLVRPERRGRRWQCRCLRSALQIDDISIASTTGNNVGTAPF